MSDTPPEAPLNIAGLVSRAYVFTCLYFETCHQRTVVWAADHPELRVGEATDVVRLQGWHPRKGAWLCPGCLERVPIRRPHLAQAAHLLVLPGGRK